MPTLVLSSPASDPQMLGIAEALDRVGVPIVGVSLLPAMDDAAHKARVRAAVGAVPGRTILGGFSLGARISAELCPELQPLALLCFAYPFHSVGDPGERAGLDALRRVRVPTRIIQGTRDNHGSEAEVRGYRLADTVELVWLRDGNHRFVPRKRCGITLAENIATAAASAITFVQSR